MAYANDYFSSTTFVYGYFPTREAAESALEHYFTSGEVFPCEFVRIYPAFGGKRWAIELKA
jgi:hypothetical protein